MKRVVIVGAGGLGREIAWVVERMNAVRECFEVLGFCDDAADKQEGEVSGYPLLGKLGGVRQRFGRVGVICALGSNRVRQRVVELALEEGHWLASVVDPSAVVAPGVELGEGCYVGIESVVSVGCRLGRGVLVNHKVCVGHDVEVGDFAQLCPGVCVSGGCKIGVGALLGTLAGTIPLKDVGDWAIVGAGCVAMREVEDGGRVVRLGGVGHGGPTA